MQSTVVLTLTLVATLAAQPQPAFDVASVKPNKTEGRANSNFPLGPGDAYTQNGGYFNATNFPLVSYIAFAYKIQGGQRQVFVDQLPAWVNRDRFDIQARAAGNPGKDQMRLMMRALLAERFKLAIHEESHQVPVAAMVVAKAGKLGPQIQPHRADSPCPLDAPPGRLSDDPRFPLLCGGLLQLEPTAPGRVRVAGRNITLAFIANTMSAGAGLGRPLVDGTGLSGNFDFNLEFAPEIPGSADGQSVPLGPSFEQALREQLGFKLEAKKTAIPVLIVDHVEHPSGN